MKKFLFLVMCFIQYTTQTMAAAVGGAAEVEVEVIDNAPLTGKKIKTQEQFIVRRSTEEGEPDPGSSFPPRPLKIYEGDLSFSAVQITALNVDKEDCYSGTGFFVTDRSNGTKDGLYRPFNMEALEGMTEGSFPKTFIVTNRHVLNSEKEPDNCKGKDKSFYKFAIHLMKRADEEGRLGSFKTAFVTVSLDGMDIKHLPNDKTVQSEIEAAIDLAAIDVSPIFTKVQSRIAGAPELKGYIPYYYAFDKEGSFSSIPDVATEIQTWGYPLGIVGGGMMPIYGNGKVSGAIPAVEKIEGADHYDVVDGYFALDVASGTSGSPIYYKVTDPGIDKSKTQLIGVAYASSNEETHRLARIISAERVKALIEPV